MTQSTAMVIHSMSEAPERWKERDGFLTDGYNKVAVDGGSYGMGTATYQATMADKEILVRAVREWRKDTAPPVAPPPPAAQVQSAPVPVSTPADQIKNMVPVGRPLQDSKSEAMEDCIDLVRKSQRAYMIHRDATILCNAIDSALKQYDATVKGGMPS